MDRRLIRVVLAVLLCASLAPAVVTKTIKSDGSGDYASFQAAWDALPTTLADDYVFEVYKIGSTSYGNVLFSGKTTGMYTVTFRAAAGNYPVISGTTVHCVEGNGVNNVKLEGLDFQSQYASVYLQNCDGWRVQGCTPRSYNNATYFDIVYVGNGCDDDSLIGNIINGGKQYAVHVQGTSGAPVTGTVIANNLIHSFNNSGQGTGIWLEQHSGTKLYYNTVYQRYNNSQYNCVKDDPGASGRTTIAQNNVLVMMAAFATSYCYNRVGFHADLTADYNCLFKMGGSPKTVGYANGAGQDWAGWQTLGFDQHGTDQDPKLLSIDLPLPKTGSPCVNTGTPVSGITKDLYGNSRPQGAGVDMGCAEQLPGAPLSGDYTINPAGSGATNFKSFTEAAYALNVYGIGGNVTFDVYAGTYYEKLDLTGVNEGGSSSITFQAREAGGVPDVVTINASGLSYGVGLSGCDRIRLRNLRFAGNPTYCVYAQSYTPPQGTTAYSDATVLEGCQISSTGSYGVWLSNGCKNDTITGCTVTVSTNATGIYASGAGTVNDRIENLVVYNNFLGNYQVGVYLNYHYGTKLLHNSFYSSATSTLLRAVSDNYAYLNGATQFHNNALWQTSTSTTAYMYYRTNMQSGATLACDYNCYYINSTGSNIFYHGTTNYTYATWRSGLGYDANSPATSTNPQFASTTNPRLKSGSPCKDIGTVLSPTIVKDFEGQSRPSGAGYDIGCDEWVSSGPISGTKTIKQDGTGDYRTFADALGAVAVHGLGGNVTFDIYRGTYPEVMNFYGLANGSYWVTFQAAQTTDGIERVIFDAGNTNNAVYFRDNANVAVRRIEFRNYTSYPVILDNPSAVAPGNDFVTVADCRMTTGNYGIYVASYCDDDSLYGNIIYAPNGNAIYSNGNSTTPNQRLVAVNNLCRSSSASGYFVNTQSIRLIYNTFCASTNQGVYTTSVTSTLADIRNNIFFTYQPNYIALWMVGAPGIPATMDNNCYYGPGMTTPVSYNGMSYTLAQWRTFSGRDAASILTDPVFAGYFDAHVKSTSPCLRKGQSLYPLWDADADGDNRDNSTPAIGADEPYVDIGVNDVIVPVGAYPLGSSLTPSAEVQNYCNTASTFTLYLKCYKGANQVYSDQKNVSLYGGETQTVDFTPWTPGLRGSDYIASCFHSLSPDDYPGNDQAGSSFQMVIADAAARAIYAPAGPVIRNTAVHPLVKVQNAGDDAGTFWVKFQIADAIERGEAGALGRPNLKVHDAVVYDESTQVTLDAGDTAQVELPLPWNATSDGDYVTSLKVRLPGDGDPSNDEVTGAVTVVPPPHHDVSVTAILHPAGTVVESTVVFPKFEVHNTGEATETFPVRFLIIDSLATVVFNKTVTVSGLAAGATREVEFTLDSWVAGPVGPFSVRCTSELATDEYEFNNLQTGEFRVKMGIRGGWSEMEPLLPGGLAKQVKDGGWLTVADDGGSRYVYAAKGNKTAEFYRYDVIGDSWQVRADIKADEGGRDKLPKKGCVGVSDGGSAIYMTKGNNTLGFWKYDIAGDSWTRLPNVPEGPDGKKVKGGNDMAYVTDDNDSSWVYLMKGYRTEFYRFNVESMHWDTLPNVPYGIAPKYNVGSFLTYDNDGAMYAHQAKYTDGAKTRHFMFRYDVATEAWDSATGMPVLGMDGGKMKSKKSKDGGSGGWYDGKLYALKGGNTCQFYAYEPSPADSWVELDTIKSFGSTAKKKKVKAGGDLVSLGDGAFFAFKGNKTNEFWRYVIPSGAQAQARSGVAADGRLQNADCRMQIAPNPLNSGYATVRYSLPKAGPVSISVFDVAGRSVLVTRSPGHLTTGSLPLDLRVLSAGVYLVRLDADGHTQSQKLVVQR